MQPAVKQAIASIRERYFEPITLNDLAAEVFVSPFHFSRVFSRETGVTPGRYLTAVRLFEAKRLLVMTSLTVSDVVCSVGYSSVGTFTSRFTRAVGMTPTQYRAPEVSELLLAVAPDFHRLPPSNVLSDFGRTCTGVDGDTGGSIVGAVELPGEVPAARVLIGVFADAIPQCGPVVYKSLRATDVTGFTLHGVPAGRWHVIAVAEHASGHDGVYLGTAGEPIDVTAGSASSLHLRMRAVRTTDPPIAITLASQLSLDSGRNGIAEPAAIRTAA
ncbi:helix-turn-helix transcriptional regulator [Haloechinothrix sp. YIM 98757]|uniref:Helix-turn-helix transcriptional regulator n=2 Tax=Haloechinothrix aidingensis TaxID=2752311 RepID=A0A837ZYP7_9PSEU|nr:helix-turn-helix transcriptional regulator [Haloechinothrix aidingensis]